MTDKSDALGRGPQITESILYQQSLSTFARPALLLQSFRWVWALCYLLAFMLFNSVFCVQVPQQEQPNSSVFEKQKRNYANEALRMHTSPEINLLALRKAAVAQLPVTFSLLFAPEMCPQSVSSALWQLSSRADVWSSSDEKFVFRNRELYKSCKSWLLFKLNITTLYCVTAVLISSSRAALHAFK